MDGYAQENASICSSLHEEEELDECVCNSPIKQRKMDVEVFDLDQNEQCPAHIQVAVPSVSDNHSVERRIHHSQYSATKSYDNRRQSAADGSYSAHYTFLPVNQNIQSSRARGSVMFQRTPR